MRRFIDIVEGSADYVAENWLRFWVNSLADEIIPVTDRGSDHDSFLLNHIDCFLTEQEVWEIEGEHSGEHAVEDLHDLLDPILERVYENGWSAVLVDGNQNSLMMRTSFARVDLLRLRRIAEIMVYNSGVAIQEIYLEGPGQHNVVLRGQADIESFIKNARLPRSRIATGP